MNTTATIDTMPAQLELPGVTTTALGCTIHLDALDTTATLDACDQLRGVMGVTRWVLGDLAAALMATEGPAEAARMLAERGHDHADLAAAVAVAVDVHPRVRRASLSWSHHREVHRLPEDQQVRWLDEATRHGWSVRRLRQAIRDDSAGDDPLPGLGRLPRPPESLLRRALETAPDGPVLWLPGAGGLSAATVRRVEVDGPVAHVVVDVDPALAAALTDDDETVGAEP